MLAEKLGRTVQELREAMSNQEWIEWSIFYGRRRQREQIAQARADWSRRR